jgi:hypothetical protein
MIAAIKNFNAQKNPFVYKELHHGTLIELI